MGFFPRDDHKDLRRKILCFKCKEKQEHGHVCALKRALKEKIMLEVQGEMGTKT